MYKIENLKQFNFRLTSLWALSEMGGSLLSALKLPFACMLLAVCSVLILSLFYQVNRKHDRPVAVAFLVVVAVKLACNPLSSPLAFWALFFQTGCCMMVFQRIRPFERAAIVAGVLCLAHTCAQILFLKEEHLNFWSLKTAFLPTVMLDRMIIDFVKSNILLEIAYFLLFLVVGWLTGRLAAHLPGRIDHETEYLQTLDALPKPVLTEKQQKKLEKKKNKKEDYGFPRFLVIAALVVLALGNWASALKLFQIALLWLIVFTDFFQRQVVPRVLFALHSRFYPEHLDSLQNKASFGNMSGRIKSAWLLAKTEKRFLYKVQRFVPLVFALCLGDFEQFEE